MYIVCGVFSYSGNRIDEAEAISEENVAKKSLKIKMTKLR